MTGRIPLWVDLRAIPVNKRLPFLHAIEEVAAEGALVARGDPHVDRPGLDPVVLDGHNRLKQRGQAAGRFVHLTDAKAVAKASKATGRIVVQADNWRIIPLENLLADRADRPDTLYAVAKSPQESALFAEVLERGVHGIVLAVASAADIFEADRLLRARYRPPKPAPPSALIPNLDGHGAEPPGSPRSPTSSPATTQATAASASSVGTVSAAAAVASRDAPQPPEAAPGPFLERATLTSIEDGGTGDRVCLDCTSLFRDGEGLLVGSTARSFALVHAETEETDYIRARPFRVNAGAVHMYLYAPESRTRYLSELRAGDPVLAVHPDGIHRVVKVGRAKIERRPHSLVRWRCADGAPGMAVLQTAETVRLVRPDGSRVAVTALRAGDAILVHNEMAARHTGLPIDEAMEER